MNSDRIWILLGKKKSGEATGEELQELEILLESRGPSDLASEVIDKVWEAPMEAISEQGFGTNSWKNIQKRVGGKSNRQLFFARRNVQRWLVAATLLLLAGSFVLLYASFQAKKRQLSEKQAKKTNQFSTPSGSKSKLELPDGTQVWLNENSTLSFVNGGFDLYNRDVYLSGEAFFDVTKNEKIPFIIHTGSIDITVLGTAFNVKSYPGNRTMETTLVRGLIEITTKRDPDRKIILKPNEKIIIPTDMAAGDGKKEGSGSGMNQSLCTITSLHNSRADVLPETVWMQPKLQFDDEPFEELAPKLEAWFNIKITIRNDVLKARRFSGVIEKETLKETLGDMQLSFPFQYERTGNDLQIFSGKSATITRK